MLYCIFFCLHFLSNIYSVVCCTVYGVLLKCTSTIWHQSVFFYRILLIMFQKVEILKLKLLLCHQLFVAFFLIILYYLC